MESIFDRITVPSAGYSGTSGAAGSAAGAAIVGSTGLVASVEPQQFEKLVNDAIDPVVLWMSAGNGAAIQNGKPAPPRTARRYVLSCSGVVFVTQSVRQLNFNSQARAIECQAIVYDNKPLG